eukprot:gene6062-6757_t
MGTLVGGTFGNPDGREGAKKPAPKPPVAKRRDSSPEARMVAALAGMSGKKPAPKKGGTPAQQLRRAAENASNLPA